MNSKIKKMSLCASNSDTQSNSCENCKTFSKKLDNLQDSVCNLYTIIERQNASIMSAFAELKAVTTKLVRQDTAAINYFPVTSDQMLKDLDKEIGTDNRDIYLSIMSKLWRNSVAKNLENILDRKIVMSYNIDGSHGKLKLKEYKNFYKVLIDSIAALPGLEQKDPEMILRQAMQMIKKKQFRQQSALNKKTEEEQMETTN